MNNDFDGKGDVENLKIVIKIIWCGILRYVNINFY